MGDKKKIAWSCFLFCNVRTKNSSAATFRPPVPCAERAPAPPRRGRPSAPCSQLFIYLSVSWQGVWLTFSPRLLLNPECFIREKPQENAERDSASRK